MLKIALATCPKGWHNVRGVRRRGDARALDDERARVLSRRNVATRRRGGVDYVNVHQVESDCCGLLTVYPVLLLYPMFKFAPPSVISPSEKVAIEPFDEVATM